MDIQASKENLNKQKTKTPKNQFKFANGQARANPSRNEMMEFIE